MKNDPRSCERNLHNCVRSLKKIQKFNGIWNGDFVIPVRCSNQLSYEATDVGSWSKNFCCDLPCVRSPKRGWESFGSSFSLLSWIKCSGARNGVVVRTLAPTNVATVVCGNNMVDKSVQSCKRVSWLLTAGLSVYQCWYLLFIDIFNRGRLSSVGRALDCGAEVVGLITGTGSTLRVLK